MSERANPSATALAALFAAAVAALLVAPGTSSAQASSPCTVIMLTPATPDDATVRAGDAITAQLADMPVDFKMVPVYEWSPDIPSRISLARRVAGDTGATSVFWIDLYSSQQLFLFIADPRGDRILVRNVESDGGGIEAHFETLAVIMRGAVKAILAGGEIGVAAPPEPAEETERRRDLLDLSVDYAMQLYAPDRPLLHGATARMSVGAGDVIRIFVGYRLQLPVEVKTDRISVGVRPHPIVAGLGARFGSGNLRLDTDLALVVDFATLKVTSLDPAVDGDAPDRPWIVSLSPGVTLGRTAGRVATFYLGVALDIALQKHSYVLENGDQTDQVLAPWRLRPIFRLGARFNLR